MSLKSTSSICQSLALGALISLGLTPISHGEDEVVMQALQLIDEGMA